MKSLENLKELLDEEVKKIVKKGDITPTELENAYKAVDILKDIETIHAMQGADEMEMEYSQRGRTGGGQNSYGMPRYYYDDGMSYRRGRDPQTGRYVSRDSYSRRGGYSRHGGSEQMIDRLESMMDYASSERERRAIEQCIEKLEME